MSIKSIHDICLIDTNYEKEKSVGEDLSILIYKNKY